MDDQQHDANPNQGLARQQKPWMASSGQHEKQADYRGPASDCCQGVAHDYIIAWGSSIIPDAPLTGQRQTGTAPVHPPALGAVAAKPQFGGLLHRYERRAA